MGLQFEHAWLPVCLQLSCLVDDKRDCLSQGDCLEMTALETGRQEGNLDDELIATFSAVRRVKYGGLAYS